MIKVRNKKTGEEVATVTSGPDGKYRVGPLYDDQEYLLEAVKEDYSFTQDGNNFSAKKLSSLTIAVSDEKGQKLEGATLSLTAGKGFRVTGSTASTGEFKFTGLNPGKYYVQALLKEYEFETSMLTVELGDGDRQRQALKAKRVSYSAFGSVSKLSGDPIQDAVVSAFCN
mmetsp:Transcript_21854/g.16214  ORF Transcript_21854/g.16214 Transcript_21854/m.16214 type:complete len:170 (+) Transcript_21854:1237-1746(+)